MPNKSFPVSLDIGGDETLAVLIQQYLDARDRLSAFLYGEGDISLSCKNEETASGN